MTKSRATTTDRSTADRIAALAVAGGVVLLVLIGFAASYATLRDLAVSAGRFSPWLAPVVPLSFDLGIVVLSLKVVLAANEGRSAIWLRLMVAGLSAATVAANASAAPTTVGRLLHAIPPAMFVICFESVIGSARREAMRLHGADVAVPPVRPTHMLLAPLTSVRQWRRQLLEAQQQRMPAVPELAPKRKKGASAATTASEPVDRKVRFHTGVVASGRAGDTDAAARLRCAEAALRADRDLTAAALAEALRTRGYACSVRTAQRVKAQALSSLERSDAAGSAEDAA